MKTESRNNDDLRIREHAIYALGHVEGWIEAYAKSTNLLPNDLAGQVGILLCAQTGREVLGSAYHLSSLRGKATQERQAPRTLALAERASGDVPPETHRPLKKHRGTKKHTTAARKKISESMHKRWAPGGDLRRLFGK